MILSVNQLWQLDLNEEWIVARHLAVEQANAVEILVFLPTEPQQVQICLR